MTRSSGRRLAHRLARASELAAAPLAGQDVLEPCEASELPSDARCGRRDGPARVRAPPLRGHFRSASGDSH